MKIPQVCCSTRFKIAAVIGVGFIVGAYCIVRAIHRRRKAKQDLLDKQYLEFIEFLDDYEE